ncbi:MAG: protein kinase [Planctomycetes bacterium]|nr:protein kinase [Planctomycetota bacterium]
MPFRLEIHAEPIPGYKLLARLGGGGFGEVWKAEAPGGLLKAIKFVYGDLQTGDNQTVRAEQELKSLSRIKTVRHPYILSLERFDIINGQLMIVMELADRNLWDRFRECRAQGLPGIPRDELLRYLEETAEALDLMNTEYQLQHLDVKPQNVFLVYNHVKVADFGLVKDLEGKVAASVTGGVTPIYAAPEMFDGWVSRFCDQYSLAIVYQELLTSHRPFNGVNVHQLIMQHLQGKPNLSSLPADEQEIIAKALSKNPEKRFASCTDLIHALWFKGGARPVVPARSSGLIPRGLIQEKLQAGVSGDPSRSADLAATPAPAAIPALPVEEPATQIVAAPPEELPPTVIPQSGRTAPPEVTGSGELIPALIVGLGEIGLHALRQLHGLLQERFGQRETLAHLRLLYLDTDPETVQTTSQGNANAGLLSREVVLARLNRASHYLKSREGRPRIDTWFNTNILYRIQRSQVTGGLRTLGRLAFIDNYRMIAQRLRADLEACTDSATLEAASQFTGLPIRSNRPRVYVVTSLAGGTGGGMFIDLAYAAREVLKGLGYARPEVLGVFLLPAVQDNPARRLALGNALAALTELNHFSAPNTTFVAKFDDREGQVRDPEAPFQRCILLPLPEEGDEASLQQATGLASEYLFRDLMTPLGRAGDTCRREALRAAGAMDSLYQNLGLFSFASPRRALLHGVARHTCQALVQQWLAEVGQPLRETLLAWTREQWTEKELHTEAMSGRLQKVCEKVLGKAPEAAFAALTDPLVPKGWWNPQLDPDVVMEAVRQIEQIVGQPSPSTVFRRPGQLEEAIHAESEALVEEWKNKLAKLTLAFLEKPGFRLAGAEEAIQQFLALMDQEISRQEPVLQDLQEKAGEAHERLQLLRPNLREIVTGGRRTASMQNELIELLRRYPRWRYQALVLKSVLRAFGGLRTYLSDQLREVGYCRARLDELLQLLQNPEQTLGGLEGRRRYLYPAGCRSLDEAVEQAAAMKPEDWEELDQRMQAMIQHQFRTLHHVCTTSAHLLRKLESAMVEEAMNFARSRLPAMDVVDLFLNQQRSDNQAVSDLARAFQAAAPGLATGDAAGPTEIALLAVPAGPREAQLRELARRAVQSSLMSAASIEDLVFYREETRLLLADLPQVGPLGQEAYQQMATSEHFPPHTRTDIAEWTPLQ